ncbi:hypothetical protein MRY82_07500 [bacterium]|nr:hypothetical protein [bacterium]
MINQRKTRLKFYTIMMLAVISLFLHGCGRPLTYDGQSFLTDPDGDQVDSIYDNCPNVYNPTQIDSDNNGLGDACEDVSSSNESPSLYSMELLNVDGTSCSRKIVWEDKSMDEVQVQIIKKYKRVSFDPIDQRPDITEYEDSLDVPIVYAGNLGVIEYDDLDLESWMKALRYQIKVTLADGNVLLSNEMNESFACE